MWSTDDDEARRSYTARAFHGFDSVISGAVDVRGCTYWTLLDHFQWVSGFKITFGLIAFDPTTCERTIKPSVRWLGDVTRGKALV